MKKRVRIGLVGDFSEKISTHVALNKSIDHCRQHLPFQLDVSWLPTETLTEESLAHQKYEGFWIAPGSPYKNDENVYNLITWARKHDFPLLGTCGGFQYMVIEYARNVLGISAAQHEESDPHAEQLLISKLACSLKGKQEEISVSDKESWLYEVLQRDRITGYFYCSYGVNPTYFKVLHQYPFLFTAFSAEGEPRALELKTNHFFNATLFQPPLDSSETKPNPLLISFFTICSQT